MHLASIIPNHKKNKLTNKYRITLESERSNLVCTITDSNAWNLFTSMHKWEIGIYLLITLKEKSLALPHSFVFPVSPPVSKEEVQSDKIFAIW